jgi:hypothetical protein
MSRNLLSSLARYGKITTMGDQTGSGNTGPVKEVLDLIDKAANAEKSDDALKFSQAALNAANALKLIPH